MKKSHQIFVITSVILLFVAIALVVVFYNGTKMLNSHFVRIEVNPKIEFLSGEDGKVESVFAVNEEAEELIIGEEFVGLSMEEAVEKFLDLCLQANYLDFEKDTNAIGLSVSSGFTQEFEGDMYGVCNKFLIDNEILGVIAEKDVDLALFREKKEKKVFSVEKLVLINSILEKTSEYSFDDLNDMSESDLIDVLEDLHEANSQKEYTKEQLANKNKLIDFNRTRLNEHRANITNQSQREFASRYDKFKKSKTKEYEMGFEDKYLQYIKS
ncbi:MAG: hypothetical protein IJA61_02190 [Clostridia bacterium]|nr:hypothetical protein [Clostridia bacterium]